MAEIMYKSKGKAPNGDPFLVVKKARGYYEYSERPGKDSIAFILYDKISDKYALIFESKPPMDERFQKEVMMTTAMGGSIDLDLDYNEICQKEVEEETGYEIPLSRIHSIGKTLVSTQMSQLCEGFLVDVTGYIKTKNAEYENSITMAQYIKDPNEFSKNKIEWLTEEGVMNNNDWKSIWIIAKAKNKNII